MSKIFQKKSKEERHSEVEEDGIGKYEPEVSDEEEKWLSGSLRGNEDWNTSKSGQFDRGSWMIEVDWGLGSEKLE